MNRGVPPTLRKARTGELTPPGMCCWALAKRVSERDMANLTNKGLASAVARGVWDSGLGEQCGEGASALLNLGGAVGGEQGVDHGDQTGAGANQCRCVVQGDASDGHQRQAIALAGLLKQFDAGSRRAGFGA